MQLTDQMLIDLRACSDGMAWYRRRGADTVEETVERLLDDEEYTYAIWLLPRMATRRGRRLMACAAARLALPVWEEAYPQDSRPRLAIDAAEAVAANDTEDNWSAATEASWAAAWAAEAAARAAEEAAWAAASAAAWAAEEAEGAARAAEAAWAACDAGITDTTIIREWLRILKQEED